MLEHAPLAPHLRNIAFCVHINCVHLTETCGSSRARACGARTLRSWGPSSAPSPAPTAQTQVTAIEHFFYFRNEVSNPRAKIDRLRQILSKGNYNIHKIIDLCMAYNNS